MKGCADLSSKAKLLIIGACNFLIWFIAFLLFGFFRYRVYEFGGTYKLLLTFGPVCILILLITNTVLMCRLNNDIKGGSLFFPVLGYLLGIALTVVDIYIGCVIKYIVEQGSRQHPSFFHYDNSLIMKEFGIVMFIIILIVLIVSCILSYINFKHKMEKKNIRTK